MVGFACAKINIGLSVTQKLSSGYHEIESILYPIQYSDVVEITDAPHTEFNCFGQAIPGLANDNLCVKAFRLMQQTYNLPHQQISLLKNLPMGAGLGGGSSDAASIIVLCNNKFKLNLSTTVLQQLAAQLGADCPFFITSQPALATGTGTFLQPVNISLSSYRALLVTPSIHISTEQAYGGISPAPAKYNLQKISNLPVSQYKECIVNDFEYLFESYPVLAEIKQQLYNAGAVYASLSGSGATVYGLFNKTGVLPPMQHYGKVIVSPL